MGVIKNLCLKILMVRAMGVSENSHHYYTTRSKNPLKKMQSLIAISCKLIRVFFVLLTRNVEYDAEKMLKDIRHPAA